MISPRLLELICCPETYQPLKEAPPELIRDINVKIAEGKLFHRSGQKVDQPLDGGLVRDDGTILYPVRNNLPELLIDKGIVLTV